MRQLVTQPATSETDVIGRGIQWEIFLKKKKDKTRARGGGVLDFVTHGNQFPLLMNSS